MPPVNQRTPAVAKAALLLVQLLAAPAAALAAAAGLQAPDADAPTDVGHAGASTRGLLQLGPDLSGCTLSLGAWAGPASGLFTLPATMTCSLLPSLADVLGTWCVSATASSGSYSQTKGCTTVLLTTGQTFQFTSIPSGAMVTVTASVSALLATTATRSVAATAPLLPPPPLPAPAPPSPSPPPPPPSPSPRQVHLLLPRPLAHGQTQ
ncbi:hypothetical protein ABPG75_005667 [Micractinium tetrahymenae]